MSCAQYKKYNNIFIPHERQQGFLNMKLRKTTNKDRERRKNVIEDIDLSSEVILFL